MTIERETESIKIDMTPSQDKAIDKIFAMIIRLSNGDEIKNVQVSNGFRCIYLTIEMSNKGDEGTALQFVRHYKSIAIGRRGRCVLLNARKGWKTRAKGIFGCCNSITEY